MDSALGRDMASIQGLRVQGFRVYKVLRFRVLGFRVLGFRVGFGENCSTDFAHFALTFH